MDNDREVSLDEINSGAFLTRLKSGDGQAFSDLFSCMVPKLCGFLSRDFQLTELDAEDVAADTMVKVHKAVSQFDPRGGAKLSTWIYRIAKNTAIDFKRKQGKEAGRAQDVPLDDTVSRQVDRKRAVEWFRRTAAAEHAQGDSMLPLILRMRRALDTLSKQDQNILLLKQSMEYEEIAEVEKVSVSALRTRYSRAMDRLLSELEKGESS
jgi:RNA polymerase sigma-70 factor (ECF subfamily)